MIQLDLFAPLPPLPPLPKLAVATPVIAPPIPKVAPTPAVVRPFAAGTLLTIAGECLPVNSSRELPSGEAEVSFRIAGGVWWVTRLARNAGAWVHGLHGPVTIGKQPAPEVSGGIAEATAARDHAAFVLAVCRECGDPDREALVEVARTQKRLYTLKGGHY